MIIFRNLLNFEPWRGLAKKSPIMSSVGQYLIMICPNLTQSDTKKYLMFMCRVRFPLDARPLFSRSIELWLSWCRINGLRGYPCSWRKYRVHRTAGILSFTPTTSASVELVVFIFCLLDAPFIIPRPNVMYATVWLRISLCTVNAASMNHSFWSSLSASIVRRRNLVFLRYLITQWIFL